MHPKWWATFAEVWPSEIVALADPMAKIDLSSEDIEAIGARTEEFRDRFEIDELHVLSEALRGRFNDALSQLGPFVHVRLGGCSFKKPGAKPGPVYSFDRLSQYVMQDNKRVAGFLDGAMTGEYPAALFVQQWKTIEPWSEFRMFMKGRKFIGASQYFHTRSFVAIQNRLDMVASALVKFAVQFREICHLDDVVVDIRLEPVADGGFKAVLIELNPLIVRTDSCLFNWKNGGDFDGTLRYRDPVRGVQKVDPANVAVEV